MSLLRVRPALQTHEDLLRVQELLSSGSEGEDAPVGLIGASKLSLELPQLVSHGVSKHP